MKYILMQYNGYNKYLGIDWYDISGDVFIYGIWCVCVCVCMYGESSKRYGSMIDL